MILKLAFRNIWRNRRRTFITAASILFAVFFAIVMRCIQEGTWDYMIDSVVRYHIGYGQIHEKGYWDEQSINRVMLVEDSIGEKVAKIPAVRGLVPRLEHFALASTGQITRGVMVTGIDPIKEDGFSGLSERVEAGRFLEAEDTGILLASGLAGKLGLSPGDSLVLLSQGFRGANAVGIYPVRGIIQFGMPEISNRMVYMALPEARHFFGAYDRASALIIDLDKNTDVEARIGQIRSALDTSSYEVMSYREMMPQLLEAKEFDVAGSYVIMTVLYLIIGFGIFGTLLMMLKEREYEFGVLKAVGMRSFQLYRMVWLESIFLGLIGCVAGALVSLPLVAWLAHSPIPLTGDMGDAYEQFGVEAVIVTVVDPAIFLNQTLVILLIVTILSLYPFFKISRMKPVEAMRG